MMDSQPDDKGILAALVERLDEQWLPRALDLEAKVNGGDLLDDLDIEFLERVFEDSNELRALLDRHPEYEELAAKVTSLYHAITARALENEKSRR
ncbi:hypothetical protein [Propionivibrio soli]|uniref:hypothetical protein n=1 Tax=Propionivibrio soli TaxID=2976531 RepID=UPI0021E9AAB6|nr:hypothetical protein [Propionivibrio soli]